MSTGPDHPADEAIRARRTRVGFYLIGLGLVLFATLTLAVTVLRAPRHSGTIEVAGQLVQLRVGLIPDPPKTGPIPVQITLTDSTGSPVAAEEVLVRYSMTRQEAQETRALPGASAGIFQAQVRFADVGSGWIEVVVRLGRSEGRLRLPVEVRPNI